MNGYTLHLGDCLEVLKTLPAGSVQTCVTSPPYFGLRDYGVTGQIGLEATPEDYVSRLVDVFRGVRRVLRDDGTVWLNLGDSYASGQRGGNTGHSDGVGASKRAGANGQYNRQANRNLDPSLGFKPKDLIGIPWRVAFALQADGWYLRSDIIWHKPNPMPESVRDRPTKAHEYLFLLSKNARYYYDADAVREDAEYGRTKNGDMYGRVREADPRDKRGNTKGANKIVPGAEKYRNRRSVWTITPKPFKGAHFATFPPDLVEPCILAGTSERGQCGACGAPWVRVVEREAERYNEREAAAQRIRNQGATSGGIERVTLGVTEHVHRTTVGWRPSCTCNAPVVPQTVLDPFAGSGTTGMVALQHGRRFVGIELNSDYLEMARARIGESVMQLRLEQTP